MLKYNENVRLDELTENSVGEKEAKRDKKSEREHRETRGRGAATRGEQERGGAAVQLLNYQFSQLLNPL